ncbi:MAG: phosphate acyltransferase, partial [candidate division WOR-3 bacterium]
MRSFNELLQKAKTLGKKRCVVVCAEDNAVLEGIRLAHDLGLIIPVLVGNQAKITELAAAAGLDAGQCEIHDEP